MTALSKDARKAESLTRQELFKTYPVLPTPGIGGDKCPRVFWMGALRQKRTFRHKLFLLVYKYLLLAQSGACFGLDQQSPAVMFQTHLLTHEERALSPIHITRLQ
jgi:hypothetical protein